MKKAKKARWDLNHAIERGDIKRLPCENCGMEPAEGHHVDYNKPLEVTWLCKNCHVKVGGSQEQAQTETSAKCNNSKEA